MSGPELMEVVEISEGEVVLRRSDSTQGSGEPLVSIRFSAEAQEILGGQAANLGKAMIASGLQMVAAMFRQQQAEQDEAFEEGEEPVAESAGQEETVTPRHRLH